MLQRFAEKVQQANDAKVLIDALTTPHISAPLGQDPTQQNRFKHRRLSNNATVNNIVNPESVDLPNPGNRPEQATCNVRQRREGDPCIVRITVAACASAVMNSKMNTCGRSAGASPCTPTCTTHAQCMNIGAHARMRAHDLRVLVEPRHNIDGDERLDLHTRAFACG